MYGSTFIAKLLSKFNLDSKAHTIPIKKCSGGQKSRIAFSTLCMSNILILDEIFDSSLDGQGTDDFFKILKSLSKENVFIISHKGDIMFDKFTNIIKFEKYKNFTRLV